MTVTQVKGGSSCQGRRDQLLDISGGKAHQDLLREESKMSSRFLFKQLDTWSCRFWRGRSVD